MFCIDRVKNKKKKSERKYYKIYVLYFIKKTEVITFKRKKFIPWFSNFSVHNFLDT